MSNVIAIEDRAFAVDEACERLGGVSRSRLYQLIRSGELRAHKIGSRTVLRQSSITAFLDSLPTTDAEQ